MRKRWILLCGLLVAALLLPGCKKALSDGHITIKAYKGLSIQTAGTPEETEKNIWDALLANCTVLSLPEEAVTAEKEKLETQYGYVTYYGDKTADELIEQIYGMTAREVAERQIVLDYAVALIAREEGLTLTDAEYRELLNQRAAEKGVESGDAYEKMFGADALKETFLQERVAEFLLAHAKP